MKLAYFRGHWPDDIIPNGAPKWLLYEVDTLSDCVLRTVEIYSDGRLFRNNLELEARFGGEFTSLVEGAFMELTSDWNLEVLGKSEFETLYAKSTDQPLMS